MNSLVLFGVLCVAAVTAGNHVPMSTSGKYVPVYVRPGLQYPYVTIPSYSYRRQYPHHGVMPGYSLPVAGAPVTSAPVTSVASSVAPTVSALTITPVAPAAAVAPLAPVAPAAAVAPRPQAAAGAPGGVIFTGTGEVEAAGTGVGLFSGDGDVNFAGDFPAGVFISEDGQAQFNGAGQIQASTVPGVGVVGSFNDFAGNAGFQGRGTAAAAGTGVMNAQGTGVAAWFGNGR